MGLCRHLLSFGYQDFDDNDRCEVNKNECAEFEGRRTSTSLDHTRSEEPVCNVSFSLLFLGNTFLTYQSQGEWAYNFVPTFFFPSSNSNWRMPRYHPSCMPSSLITSIILRQMVYQSSSTPWWPELVIAILTSLILCSQDANRCFSFLLA